MTNTPNETEALVEEALRLYHNYAPVKQTDEPADSPTDDNAPAADTQRDFRGRSPSWLDWLTKRPTCTPKSLSGAPPRRDQSHSGD